MYLLFILLLLLLLYYLTYIVCDFFFSYSSTYVCMYFSCTFFVSFFFFLMFLLHFCSFYDFFVVCFYLKSFHVGFVAFLAIRILVTVLFISCIAWMTLNAQLPATRKIISGLRWRRRWRLACLSIIPLSFHQPRFAHPPCRIFVSCIYRYMYDDVYILIQY